MLKCLFIHSKKILSPPFENPISRYPISSFALIFTILLNSEKYKEYFLFKNDASELILKIVFANRLMSRILKK